jgi:hypothetical protein
MRIKFERTGGFAGMKIQAAFDVDELPPEQADPLKTLLDQAEFFSLPSQFSSRPGVADQFEYDISVEADGKEHRVRTSDGAAPEALRPVFENLTRLARAQARR